MSIKILEISKKYDSSLCHIIKTVGAEFGAIGDGFGPSDAEVENMSRYYSQANRSVYLVALVDGRLVGGCGIAPFDPHSTIYANTCELKKLFLVPESRGLGVGKQLSEACLDYAKKFEFEQCYLDTLSSMSSAISLYQKLGFEHLTKPLEGTLHNACDVWMLKQLR